MLPRCLLATTSLQEFGIDIAKLTTEGGKELVFNEFGVGGGISPSGDQPARTSEQVGLFAKPPQNLHLGFTRLFQRDCIFCKA